MSKIAFLADLHCHNFSEFGKTIIYNDKPINSRLYDLLNTITNAAKSASNKGCTHLVILGDVFHLRGQIPTDVMQYVYDMFDWIHTRLDLEIIIMTGNHDQADKAGQIHSVYALKGVAQIVDTAEMIEVEDTNLWMIPYTPSHEDLIHCIERLDLDPDDDTHYNILCLHAGVDGSYIGPVEYKIKDPLTLEDLPTEKFAQILLGHYHKPQTLASNVRYVGSPVQHTRAEMGDTKRWIMWDEGHIRSIKTKAKQFFSIKASSRDMEFLPGYYDITLDNDLSVADIQQAFEGHSECSYKIISTKQANAKKARIKVNASTTDDKLLQKYLKHVNDGTLDVVLHKVGVDYLGKATNNQSAKTQLGFTHVSIQNFLSISNANLDLNRPGDVIAVLGDNQDAEGFDSNGSGKSSLLPESIYWCLFGQVARDLPADKVVNNVNKRDCCVKLELTCDETIVVVQRYRKHKELGGTGLNVFVDGTPITQGSVAETEKLLWQMLGLDYTTFSSIVAFSPENLHFVSSNDADQKRVLDSILQTSRFSAALDLVKEDAKALKTSKQEATEDLRVIEGGVKTLQANLADYKTASAQFMEKEAKRRKDLQGSIDTEQEELSEFKDDLKEAAKAVDKQNKAIEAFEIPDITELSEQEGKLNRVLGGTKADRATAKAALSTCETKLALAAEQAGKPCPTCGQPVMNTAKLMATLSTDRSAYTSAIALLDAKITLIGERLTAIATAMAEYNTRTSAKMLMINELAKLEKTRNTVNSKITLSEAQLKNLKASLKDVPTNEYESKLIPATLKKLEEANARSLELQEQIVDLDEKLEQLSFWITGFGNGGVKSFLFDQIIPELTEYANYYVDQLAGDSLKIEFHTQSDTGKEKFSIKAYNSEGSDLYGGNSSGERRRIDICVMLALFRVANNRIKMSILLLDELFDTLDETGLENTVTVLEEMAKDLDLTIFVTSHTNLANMLHESITVCKKNGLATLMED